MLIKKKSGGIARRHVMKHKGGLPPLMIYQACNLDKQKENFW